MPRTAARRTPLDGDAFDVVVMGGGAVGASASQHLAAKGYKVLLVEQGDFGSGTSSRSSRLLYCGLSYLAPSYPLWQLPFRPLDAFARLHMAWTCMRCRSEIVSTSPDRVKACEFVFPAQAGGRYPSWSIEMGFGLLRLFQSRTVPLNVRRMTPAEAARDNGIVRQLDGPSLVSVIRFREYQYDWAERICMDAVMDAERLGARVENYVKVRDFRHENGEWRVSLGEGPRPGRTAAGLGDSWSAEVRARFLVNAAGPWIDRLLRHGPKPGAPKVAGIKGVNLVVRLPAECRGLGLEAPNALGEAFYVMPWGDHHFIGPTETPFDGHPEDARVLPEEVDFLIGEANRIFPGLRLSPHDVIYRWCGVRPGTASSRPTRYRSLALQDLAGDGLPNAVAVTGAPIMLHRVAGRKVAAFVGRRIQPTERGGTVDYGARHLPEGDGPAIAGLAVTTLRAAAQSEHVKTLVDLMFRRVDLGWRADMGLGVARDVAEAVADILGWDADAIHGEVAAYRAFVHDNFAPREADMDGFGDPVARS